jgi:hypothetical protein
MDTRVRIKTRRWFRLAFLLLPLTAIIDTVIPFLFKRIINRYLTKHPTYKGNIGGFTLSVLRRKLVLNNVIIEKVNAESKQPSAFLSLADVQVIYSWSALWKGELVLELEAIQPSVVFTQNRLKQLETLKFDLNFPITIKSVTIAEGTFDYIDASQTPVAALGAEHILFKLNNPENLPLWQAHYTASISADICEGRMNGDLRINLDHLRPNFDLNFSIRGMNLVCLNAFFLNYANFDVNKGQLDLFIEAEAKTGEFGGYIKPIIRDLDVLGVEDKGKGLANQIWQGILGFVAEVLENQKHDQIASKIPFKGTFKNPKVNVGYAVVEVLVNAFVKAVTPSFDYWSRDIFKKKRA